MSIASCTSPSPSAITLPISLVTSSPSSCLFLRSSSPARNRISPRRGAGIRRQSEKAALAAVTARSTSSCPESGASATVLRLSAGLRLAKRLPSTASDHLPAMKFLISLGMLDLLVYSMKKRIPDFRRTARLRHIKNHSARQSLPELLDAGLLQRHERRRAAGRQTAVGIDDPTGSGYRHQREWSAAKLANKDFRIANSEINLCCARFFQYEGNQAGILGRSFTGGTADGEPSGEDQVAEFFNRVIANEIQTG